MADPPQEYKVETYAKGEEIWGDNNDRRTDEVLFEGGNRTWKIYAHAADPVPEPGTLLRGWLNDAKGSFGIAKDRPQNGGGSRSRATTSTGQTSMRDDATGQSIERQVAAKAAAEMAVAAGGDAPTLIANFEAYFDIVAAKIAGVPLVKADG